MYDNSIRIRRALRRALGRSCGRFAAYGCTEATIAACVDGVAAQAAAWAGACVKTVSGSG
jgi:hypothetical protein